MDTFKEILEFAVKQRIKDSDVRVISPSEADILKSRLNIVEKIK
ncbi:MAG: hypothetical protein U9O94_09355 [Nanoarchaeota archaeon]|nr:hypothetical protein [Nanoarchaeota archaeon]